MGEAERWTVSCRVFSSERCSRIGGREWERGMDEDEKEDGNSDWRKSLEIEQHKGDGVDQERDDKEGIAAARDAPKWKRERSGHMTRLPTAASGLVPSGDFVLDESILFQLHSAPSFSCPSPES